MTVKQRTARVAPRKSVNLALQGGGAHGAFAWGVLDRLIEDGRLTFEGISATSAGAMNTASAVSGSIGIVGVPGTSATTTPAAASIAG